MDKKRKGNWGAEKRQKGRKGQKKKKVDDEDEEIFETAPFVKENKLLEEYYKLQFKDMLDMAEFPLLLETMKQPLPITFRVSPAQIGNDVLSKLFSSKDCLNKILEMSKQLVLPQEAGREEKEKEAPVSSEPQIKELPVKHWDFYPGNLLFEIAMTRHELKRSEGTLRKVHKFIQMCTDCGLINRQEVVSMLPPFLLDVQPGMKLLDMCAAPGSKTSQLLEKCFGDPTQHHDLRSEVTKTGIVVANDSDYSRSFMLTHQLQRFDTASLLVLNHDGQNFPTLYYDKNASSEGYDSRYFYDRVLCDVPCSSDAAIRKIPLKWKDWTTNKAFGLHPLQLKLLMRALQLVKVGGLVCYSTCSMNPIEDEAVVHAAIKMYSPAIELVDISNTLKGFKYRKGLTHWHVMTENATKDGFTEFNNFADVPKTTHGKIKETMFCEDFKALAEEEHIDRCVRVLPHDQNTGGFFVAILRKVGELGAKKTVEEKKELSPPKEDVKALGKPGEKEVKMRVAQFERVDVKDPETEFIKIFFGLDNFPMHLLYTIQGNMKTVILVTEAVNEFLELVAKQGAKDSSVVITNMGVKCFERCKSQYKGSACLFRIIQGGAKYLLPFMTKRVVKCTLATLRAMLGRVFLNIEDIPDLETKEEIKKMSIGSFLLYTEVEDPKNPGKMVKEPLVAHKSEEKINVVADKFDVTGFKLRHFFA